MAQQAGQKIMLIDKGRRVGGRVSARRSDGFVFNHGAQFATSRSSDFGDMLRAASTAGMAANWQIEDTKMVVIGKPMMRAIPLFLANNLPIQQNRRIASIVRKTDYIQCVDTDDIPITAKKRSVQPQLHKPWPCSQMISSISQPPPAKLPTCLA